MASLTYELRDLQEGVDYVNDSYEVYGGNLTEDVLVVVRKVVG